MFSDIKWKNFFAPGSGEGAGAPSSKRNISSRTKNLDKN